MEFLIIIAGIAFLVYMLFIRKKDGPPYEYKYPGQKEKENEKKAILNTTFVQESIKVGGTFYPETVNVLKNEFNLLTHAQLKACFTYLVLLEADWLDQDGMPKDKAWETGCIIVGSWSGHDSGYISYLTDRKDVNAIIENLNLIDNEIKRHILYTGIEIISFRGDGTRPFNLAISPFIRSFPKKSKLVEMVCQSSIGKKITKNAGSIEGYMEVFASFCPDPKPINAWTLTISTNPQNRSELLYYKNNQAMNLTQPECGTILQMMFVECQNPQLWVLGTKGLQAYENGQYVDIFQDCNGQALIKDTNNPLVDIDANENGDIIGVHKDGEISLIKTAS